LQRQSRALSARHGVPSPAIELAVSFECGAIRRRQDDQLGKRGMNGVQ
jgi:hypothetical protein